MIIETIIKSILLIISLILSWFVSKNGSRDSYIYVFVAYGGSEIVFMFTCAFFSTKIGKKEEENEFDSKYYGVHIGLWVITGTNAVFSLMFFYCDLMQFFTFYKPAFTMDAPFFYIPNKILSASIYLTAVNGCLYFLIPIAVI